MRAGPMMGGRLFTGGRVVAWTLLTTDFLGGGGRGAAASLGSLSPSRCFLGLPVFEDNVRTGFFRLRDQEEVATFVAVAEIHEVVQVPLLWILVVEGCEAIFPSGEASLLFPHPLRTNEEFRVILADEVVLGGLHEAGIARVMDPFKPHSCVHLVGG